MAENPDAPDGRDAKLAERRAMVETIVREVGWSGTGDGGRELDPMVRDAMLRVPREAFVPPDLREQAYDRCRSATSRPSRSR
jgi:protein-L-isoaspartate O-methyltransferase